MFVVPMPHTGIMSYSPSAADLKNGTLIKWTTDDPAVLSDLHDSIVSLVQVVGISGMMEITNMLKMTEQVQKKFGGAGSEIQEWVEESAVLGGVSFPMPANILKYLKGIQ